MRILICSADSADCAANLRTSSATTAKPLPCSPARAASIAALSASRLVCSLIALIASTICPICFEFSPSCVTTFADADTLRSMSLILRVAVSMSCEPFKAASAVSFVVSVMTFVLSDIFSISPKTTSTFFCAKLISPSCLLMFSPTSIIFPDMCSEVSADCCAFAVNSSLDAATCVEVCDILVIKLRKLFFMLLKASDNSPISSPEEITKS